MAIIDEAHQGAVAALIDRGEQRGCVALSEIDELVQSLELSSDELSNVYEQLEAKTIELRDDCGREETAAEPVDDLALASATTDALQLFLNEIGRHQSRLVRTRIASNLSPWLAKTQVGDVHTVAISHGEGRFVASPDLLTQLATNGQI